jgi:serine protease Do
MNIREPHNRMRDGITRVPSLLLGFVLIFSLLACKGQNAAMPATNTADTSTTTVPVTSGAVSQNSYADVVSRVAPAVVTIRAERRVRPAQQHPFMDDPFFREFFGDRFRNAPQQQPRVQQGLGSGVIVSQDGYILTNHHVVDGAENIEVQLTDRRSFKAKLVGSDPPSDLAVLKVETKSLPVLPLGDSDRVRVGDVTLAIGNPLGVGQTVTSGIISAKGRSTRGGGVGAESFEDFIQTDAPINQGNSGGALINTNGELIGINSQILSPSGGNIGIGFAIPSNMAKEVMDQLIKTGKVRRSMVGIVVGNVDSDMAENLGLSEVRGVIVNDVSPNSPAERAGIKRGDVITKLNNENVIDSNSFRNKIASTTPGTEVTLTVLRGGREQQIKATLAERTSSGNQRGEGGGSGDGGGDTDDQQLGLSVEPLTPDIAGRLGVRSGVQGVVVNRVDPDGPAADAGIREGDVIEEVNYQAVRSASDLKSAVQKAGSKPSLVLIHRRDQSIFLTIRPRK